MIQKNIAKFTTLFNNLRAGRGNKSKALKGGFWLGSATGIEQALRFFRNIMITRLIAPESLGVMSIIFGINAALECFTQVGMREAVVQNPDSREKEFLNSVWWISLARSIGVFCIGLALTPFLINYYKLTANPVLLPLSYLNIVFAGLISPRAFVALKDMNYRKWTNIYQGGSIIAIITTIVLAYFFRNVWVLIIGNVFEALFRLILSYIVCPYFPTWRFNKKYTSSLVKYNLGMFGLPIMFLLYRQADIFVVGKLFAKHDVGLYGMAASLAKTPLLIVSVFVAPILMPIISKLNGKNDEINRVNEMTTFLLFIFCIPMIIFSFFYSKELLQVLYGKEYAGVAVPFFFMFTSTLMQVISSPIATTFLGIGKPALHRLFTGLRAAITILVIFPLTKVFGLEGAAFSGLAAMIISYFFQLQQMRKFTGYNMTNEIKWILLQSVVATSILAGSSYVANVFSNPMFRLLSGVAGLSICFLLSALFSFKKLKHYNVYLKTLKRG